MPYRFKDQELIGTAIPRIAREQARRAIDNLTGDDMDLDEAIHDSRKCFKKIRAVLRLVRDEIGEENYQMENQTYRDAGRKLSDLRDDAVILQTLDSVLEKNQKQYENDSVRQFRDSLETAYQQTRQRFARDKKYRSEVVSSIRNAQSRIGTWSLSREDFNVLEKGLKRVYKRGRNGLRSSLKNPEMEVLHDWRKRVKYLWYHVRILRPIWTELLKSLADSLHKQSDLLGEDHDLAILRQVILEEPNSVPDSSTEQKLLNLIDNEREKLQREAMILGQKIYAEKPAAFVRRIRTYWDASR